MHYQAKELSHFWEKGKRGEVLVKNLKKDIKLANKHGFSCLVVHLKGRYTQIGEQRLLKVLNICEKYNVNLAVENLDNEKLFVKIFEKLNHPNLKFCYDLGHHNLWMKNIDLLEVYGNKLVALHLHSNMGKCDTHSLKKFGNINWDTLAQKLAKLPDIPLDFELLMKDKPKNMTVEQVLKDCFKDAKYLKEKINYYRNKNTQN